MNAYRNRIETSSWPKWLKHRIGPDRQSSPDQFMVTGRTFQLQGGDSAVEPLEAETAELASRIRCFRAKHFGL